MDDGSEGDCDFEHSPFSGRFSADGIAVEVEIYRISGTNDLWRLEVVSEYGRCTRWHTQFDTEEEAYQAFFKVVEANGMSFFDRVEPGTRH